MTEKNLVSEEAGDVAPGVPLHWRLAEHGPKGADRPALHVALLVFLETRRIAPRVVIDGLRRAAEPGIDDEHVRKVHHASRGLVSDRVSEDAGAYDSSA